MMDHFRVDVVVHGKTEVMPDVDGSDPYAVSILLQSTKFIFILIRLIKIKRNQKDKINLKQLIARIL